MTDVAELMEQAAQEALAGDRIKQIELVNIEFVVHSIKMVDVTDKATGEKGQTLVAVVELDGEEPKESWMGGVVTTAQLSALSAAGKLPLRVKQIKDGQAYKLLPLGDVEVRPNGSTTVTAPVSKTAQDMAGELFAAAVTAKPDGELLDLCSGVGIALAYGDDGRLALPELSTQQAAALIGVLR